MTDNLENDFWTYRARIDHTRTGIVDGDTLDLQVDAGFFVTRHIRVRLKGVDTGEIYGYSKDSDEYKRGIEHKHFVEDWVQVGAYNWDGDYPFVVKTEKTAGKYGRWIGTVIRRSDGSVLNQALTQEYDDVASEY